MKFTYLLNRWKPSLAHDVSLSFVGDGVKLKDLSWQIMLKWK